MRERTVKNQRFITERSRSEMNELSRQRGSEEYGACGDEGAPSEVTQKQLDELHIVCTAKKEQATDKCRTRSSILSGI